jgi:hypothetical protein
LEGLSLAVMAEDNEGCQRLFWQSSAEKYLMVGV